MGRRRGVSALASSPSAAEEARERYREQKRAALVARGFLHVGTARALGGLGELYKLTFGRSPCCSLVERVYAASGPRGGRVDYYVAEWAVRVTQALDGYLSACKVPEKAAVVRAQVQRLFADEEQQAAVLAAYALGGSDAVSAVVYPPLSAEDPGEER